MCTDSPTLDSTAAESHLLVQTMIRERQEDQMAASASKPKRSKSAHWATGVKFPSRPRWTRA